VDVAAHGQPEDKNEPRHHTALRVRLIRRISRKTGASAFWA
jgi:hypothetical protein